MHDPVHPRCTECPDPEKDAWEKQIARLSAELEDVKGQLAMAKTANASHVLCLNKEFRLQDQVTLMEKELHRLRTTIIDHTECRETQRSLHAQTAVLEKERDELREDNALIHLWPLTIVTDYLYVKINQDRRVGGGLGREATLDLLKGLAASKHGLLFGRSLLAVAKDRYLKLYTLCEPSSKDLGGFSYGELATWRDVIYLIREHWKGKDIESKS